MKRRTKIILIIIGVIIILISIPIIWMILFLSGLEKPDVTVKDIRFKNMDPTGSVTLLLTVDIFNPNDITITLGSVHLDIIIDNSFFGHIDQEVHEDIVAKKNTTIELELVVIDHSPLPDSTVVELEIHGFVTISVSFLSLTVPIDVTKEVDLKEEANQEPMAMIVHNGRPVVLTGTSITFDGGLSTDVDGTIELYEWDFGDGGPSQTGETVTHSFTHRGQYTVTLMVYDNCEASGTDTADIRVIGLG